MGSGAFGLVWTTAMFKAQSWWYDVCPPFLLLLRPDNYVDIFYKYKNKNVDGAKYKNNMTFLTQILCMALRYR